MLYMPLKVALFHHHQEISLWHCFQVILKEACMDFHSSIRIPSLQCWTCSKDMPCSDSWKHWFFWDYGFFSRCIIPLLEISAKKVKYLIINNVRPFFRTILDWFYSRKWLWVYAEVSLQCSAWWVLWVCAFLIHAFWNKVLPICRILSFEPNSLHLWASKKFEYRWTSFDSNFNRIGGFPVFFSGLNTCHKFLNLWGVFRLNQEEMISKENRDLFFTYVTDIAKVSQDAQVAHVNII